MKYSIFPRLPPAAKNTALYNFCPMCYCIFDSNAVKIS